MKGLKDLDWGKIALVALPALAVGVVIGLIVEAKTGKTKALFAKKAGNGTNGNVIPKSASNAA